MIHWEIADRLIRECGALPPVGGLPPPDVPAGYQIPKPNRWIVEWGMRQVADHFPPTHAMLVEAHFVYEFDRFNLSGHKDLHTIDRPGEIYTGGDWKTGYHPVVSAEINDQILGYLALAKRAYPNTKQAKFIVAQPRNNEEDGFERISAVEMDDAELKSNLESIEQRINAAMDDPMTVNSGMVQCAWCPVGIQCEAYKAELGFMKATLTPEGLASIQATADDALLADVIISSRTIRRGLEDAERLLKDRIATQGNVVATDGTTITAKLEGGQYDVTNPEGAWKAVQELIPAGRIPHILKYSTSRLIDEIADANKVHKGGAAGITARTLFDIMMKPNLEQGTRTKLIFTP